MLHAVPSSVRTWIQFSDPGSLLRWISARRKCRKYSSPRSAGSGTLRSNPQHDRSRMRKFVIAGTLLIVVGLWLIIRPPALSHQENAFKLGEFQATFEERRPLPGWVGGIALGAGVVLVSLSVLRRS